ncbi:WecB/TagA/CpsF family glycosyltransferase [Lysobacter niabensis]|uniref:WecB/TagA/CpsF family glycosyltransferase n=1 Tax=Agrilutibacter niabensis TaxID=380628 RepID=UPI00361D313D
MTPNVDHILALASNDRFVEAYRRAELRVVDGWPVSVALKWLHGVEVPLVPGSDLVPALFDECERGKVGLRVFLLGAAPGVAEIAAGRMSERWSTIRVTGTCSPNFGFENDPSACQSICDLISAASPDLLVVGLGAPKQELWVSENAWRIRAKVAVCAGATIDFLSGTKKRAPYWVRSLRLEWAFRIVQEPRRLMKRYVKGMILFPLIVLREKFR